MAAGGDESNWATAPVFGMTPNEIVNVQSAAMQNVTEKNRGLLLGQELRFNALANPDKLKKISNETIGSFLDNQIKLDKLDPNSDEALLTRTQLEKERLILKEAYKSLPSETRTKLYNEASAMAKAKYADRYEKAQAEGAEQSALLKKELRPGKVEEQSVKLDMAKTRLADAQTDEELDAAVRDYKVAREEARTRKAEADAGTAETKQEVAAKTAASRIQEQLDKGDIAAANAEMKQLQAENYPAALEVSTQIGKQRLAKLDEEVKALKNKVLPSKEDQQKLLDLTIQKKSIDLEVAKANARAKKIKELKVGDLMSPEQQRVINNIEELAARVVGYDPYLDGGNEKKTAEYKAQLEAEAKKQTATGVLNPKLYPLVTGKTYAGKVPESAAPAVEKPAATEAYTPPAGAILRNIKVDGIATQAYKLSDGTYVDKQGKKIE